MSQWGLSGGGARDAQRSRQTHQLPLVQLMRREAP
jgi:hypothetical protein